MPNLAAFPCSFGIEHLAQPFSIIGSLSHLYQNHVKGFLKRGAQSPFQLSD
jgi:hypothetical protein